MSATIEPKNIFHNASANQSSVAVVQQNIHAIQVHGATEIHCFTKILTCLTTTIVGLTVRTKIHTGIRVRTPRLGADHSFLQNIATENSLQRRFHC